jgi:hypothetical protein
MGLDAGGALTVPRGANFSFPFRATAVPGVSLRYFIEGAGRGVPGASIDPNTAGAGHSSTSHLSFGRFCHCTALATQCTSQTVLR